MTTLPPCPACSSPSIYSTTEDRYFHADGTSNRTCWAAILRGESERPDPDSCHICERHIGKTRSRYLIRDQHVVCTMCLFNDRRPERTRALHALAAPDCAVDWHDHWDHSETFLSGTRAGIAWQIRELSPEVAR